MVDNASPTLYGVNDLNECTNVNGTALMYDSNGNLTNDSVWSFSYDYENRLIGASGGGTNITYVYDAIGRLIERRTSGASQSTNRFCYAGWQLIAEYDGAGALQTKYVNGPGIDEPVRMQRGGIKYYFEQDGLGNVTELASAFVLECQIGQTGSALQSVVFR